jgi:hypothetical protein
MGCELCVCCFGAAPRSPFTTRSARCDVSRRAQEAAFARVGSSGGLMNGDVRMSARSNQSTGAQPQNAALCVHQQARSAKTRRCVSINKHSAQKCGAACLSRSARVENADAQVNQRRRVRLMAVANAYQGLRRAIPRVLPASTFSTVLGRPSGDSSTSCCA